MNVGKPLEDEWLVGFAVALAEMHRHGKDGSGVCLVARAAGLTFRKAKRVGVDPYDLKELKLAGVK